MRSPFSTHLTFSHLIAVAAMRQLGGNHGYSSRSPRERHTFRTFREFVAQNPLHSKPKDVILNLVKSRYLYGGLIF